MSGCVKFIRFPLIVFSYTRKYLFFRRVNHCMVIIWLLKQQIHDPHKNPDFGHRFTIKAIRKMHAFVFIIICMDRKLDDSVFYTNQSIYHSMISWTSQSESNISLYIFGFCLFLFWFKWKSNFS